jgi:hypothetical protein
MPAITFGVAAYVKKKTDKTNGKVRWLNMTEAEMTAFPLGLLATKIESGNSLPAPRAGYQWKHIRMMTATSIFSTPSESDFYALEKQQKGAQMSMDALGTFLTQRQAYAPHVPPPEVEAVAPFQWVGEMGIGSSYLTTQEAQGSPEMADASGISGGGLGEFLYATVLRGRSAPSGFKWIITPGRFYGRIVPVSFRLADFDDLGRRGGGGRHGHRHGGHGHRRHWRGGFGPIYYGDPFYYDPYYAVYEPPVILTEENTVILDEGLKKQLEEEKKKAEEEKKKSGMLGVIMPHESEEAVRALHTAIEQMIPIARKAGKVIARLSANELRAGDLVVLKDG